MNTIVAAQTPSWTDPPVPQQLGISASAIQCVPLPLGTVWPKVTLPPRLDDVDTKV